MAKRTKRQRPTTECDCCGKQRSDVKCIGQDGNGEPDAPAACFVCRVELKRGNQWDQTRKKYVAQSEMGMDQ